MRNQIQMLGFLNENISSHEFKSGNNKIYGKKLIGSRSFCNFTITFLKNVKDQISLSMQGVTKRYKDENELIRVLGSVAIVEYNLYNNASYELDKVGR